MRVVLADSQIDPDSSLRRILLGHGLTCDMEDVVKFGGLPERLAAVRPDLVLVRCNGAQEEALQAIRTTHQITDAPILAAGVPGIPLVREAMRAGAQEFLDFGRLREDLGEALTRIESGRDDIGKRGKIISLFSPTGGAGVSTIAVNLAAALAAAERPTAEKVALVDLNPPPSDLCSLLDLEPKHTTAEVLGQWERLDSKMLAVAMTEHSSGIHVLAQPGCPLNGSIPRAEITLAAVRQVFILLRRIFPLVVVDLGHTLSEEQVEAMRQSNLVGIVARADVPGLRRVNWALDALTAMNLNRDRFKLVLNGYGGSSQVKAAKVEAALHMKIFWSVPENSALVTRSRNEGLPLSGIVSLARIKASFAGFARGVRAQLDGAKA